MYVKADMNEMKSLQIEQIIFYMCKVWAVSDQKWIKSITKWKWNYEALTISTPIHAQGTNHHITLKTAYSNTQTDDVGNTNKLIISKFHKVSNNVLKLQIYSPPLRN
jgi:hypothetical protein